MNGRQYDSAKSYRLKFLSIVLASALLVYFTSSYWLPFLGNYLVVSDRIGKTGAIYVLGGSVPNRIMEAVHLYHDGYSGLIILSRYPEPEGYDYIYKKGISYPEGHDINRDIAIQLGVPINGIHILPRRVSSTHEELVQLYSYLRENNLGSVILVSSKSHTRRVSIIFSDITRGKIKALTRHTRYDSYNPDLWWKYRDWLRQTMFEYQKLIYYKIADNQI